MNWIGAIENEPAAHWPLHGRNQNMLKETMRPETVAAERGLGSGPQSRLTCLTEMLTEM